MDLRRILALTRVRAEHDTADGGNEQHDRRHLERKQMVGEKEAADRTVNVNTRSGETLGTQPLEAFVERALREVRERTLTPQ